MPRFLAQIPRFSVIVSIKGFPVFHGRGELDVVGDLLKMERVAENDGEWASRPRTRSSRHPLFHQPEEPTSRSGWATSSPCTSPRSKAPPHSTPAGRSRGGITVSGDAATW